MTFRHWTPAERIPLILATGVRATDSNVSMVHSHAGPPVVWLLDPNAHPGYQSQHGLMAAKRTGWVDVDVPAIRWVDWEWTHRMDPEWRETMIRAGGGPDLAAQWFVWPAHIRPARIVDHYPQEA